MHDILALEQWKFKNIKFFEVLWVAILYIIAARIGQIYAISPGNVTPIWIPSGLMIALSLYLGPRIWPGIFIGAFSGNAWAYFSFESLSVSLSAIGAGLFNGIGDVISTLGVARIIFYFAKTDYPVTSIRELAWYIYWGVVCGSLVSAIFGVSGLMIFGFTTVQDMGALLLTWFVGDAVGALIFGPLLLSWLHPLKQFYRLFYPVLIGLVIYSAAITAIIFELFVLTKLQIFFAALFLPVLLILMINYSQRTVFTIQASVSAIAIYATAEGLGPFSSGTGQGELIYLQIFIAIFSLIIYAIAIITCEKQQSEVELTKQKAELEKLYRQDALTGIWNRYRIKEFMEHELALFERNQRPFGVILIDIDNFKSINDDYGHLTGDRILVQVSELISKHIRQIDLFGRWGGEEFVIIVSETDKPSIMTLAEKLRTGIEHHEFDIKRKVTISLGVSLARPGDSELKLLDRVDEGLYQSKHGSKNQVSFIE